jgi:mono/diheme cytochrome c family protein
MGPIEERSRGHIVATRLLFFVGLLTGCASAGPGPGTGETPSEEPTIAVFTVEQAARGQRVFTTVCSACHGRNEFTGPIFGFTWMADSVGALFQHISTKMPQDRPGSLTSDQYAAVTAYLLQLNGRTPGDKELPADPEQLSRMRW